MSDMPWMLREAKRLLEEGTSNSLMAHQRKRWDDDRARLIEQIDLSLETTS